MYPPNNAQSLTQSAHTNQSTVRSHLTPVDGGLFSHAIMPPLDDSKAQTAALRLGDNTRLRRQRAALLKALGVAA